MKYQLIHQVPSETDDSTFFDFVRNAWEESSYDIVAFASAYATNEGASKFLSLFGDNALHNGSWLIGLDDYFTQPSALERLSTIPNSTLRVSKPSKSRKRIFHPKILFMGDSEDPTNCSLIVGSSNLTLRGLKRNIEASGILYSESEDDSINLTNFWARYWAIGEPLTAAYLGSYKNRYEIQKAKRRRAGLGIVDDAGVEEQAVAEQPPGEILGNDAAEVMPEDATVCWIEVGRNTAMGRELEFKAEQARFFGLPSAGGNAEYRSFNLSNNLNIELRLKYQENGMWRLQMNNEVPEVAAGLRPYENGRQGRSPFVAVFRRVRHNLIDLRFIQDTSAEFNEMKRESRRVGALGRTTTREYGWY